MKFLAGNVSGMLIAFGMVYVVCQYSYLPDIYIINHIEERSHPLPFLTKQYYEAMEAHRIRLHKEMSKGLDAIIEAQKKGGEIPIP